MCTKTPLSLITLALLLGVLPATKAARFYQLKNKMDTEIDFVLSGGIPLVES